nr:MAG TPA: hypothetical protein [Caudoviricetes sp.]
MTLILFLRILYVSLRETTSFIFGYFYISKIAIMFYKALRASLRRYLCLP